MALLIIQFLAVISTGLISGFFYAYSCSVNRGLGRLPDGNYLAAMRSINRAVLNPIFFGTFFGTLILLPVATWLEFRLVGTSITCYLLLGSSLLYFFGVFLVTTFGNVPLNESLDEFDTDTASEEALQRRRLAFEKRWNRLHTIRTVANIIAFASAAWAYGLRTI